MSERIAHEPVERRLHEVAAEVALTAGVAYLVGVCLAIAAANEQAPAIQLVFVLFGIGLVLGYGFWLLGGSGALLAAVNLPLLILAADALLVSSRFLDIGAGGHLLGPDLVGNVPPLLAVAAAGTGLICGLVLPGPHRLRGTHRRRPVTHPSAHLSHDAVAERLRTAPEVPAAPPSPHEAIWFDDSTDQDGLLPVEPAAEPDSTHPDAASQERHQS